MSSNDVREYFMVLLLNKTKNYEEILCYMCECIA